MAFFENALDLRGRCAGVVVGARLMDGGWVVGTRL